MAIQWSSDIGSQPRKTQRADYRRDEDGKARVLLSLGNAKKASDSVKVLGFADYWNLMMRNRPLYSIDRSFSYV